MQNESNAIWIFGILNLVFCTGAGCRKRVWIVIYNLFIMLIITQEITEYFIY